MADRIAALQKLLALNDRDVFVHYSLAMEYVSAGKRDLAAAEFARCIELDENYLAAYVEAAKCHRAAGQLAQARAMFTRGLDLAKRLGQTHTQDYIQGQLEGLGASGTPLS
jgi:Tfp pilus assembly protein PilF